MVRVVVWCCGGWRRTPLVGRRDWWAGLRRCCPCAAYKSGGRERPVFSQKRRVRVVDIFRSFLFHAPRPPWIVVSCGLDRKCTVRRRLFFFSKLKKFACETVARSEEQKKWWKLSAHQTQRPVRRRCVPYAKAPPCRPWRHRWRHTRTWRSSCTCPSWRSWFRTCRATAKCPSWRWSSTSSTTSATCRWRWRADPATRWQRLPAPRPWRRWWPALRLRDNRSVCFRPIRTRRPPAQLRRCAFAYLSLSARWICIKSKFHWFSPDYSRSRQGRDQRLWRADHSVLNVPIPAGCFFFCFFFLFFIFLAPPTSSPAQEEGKTPAPH